MAKISNIVSFAEFKKAQSAKQKDPMGTLVWLHCPTCKSLEYTHVVATAGRTHRCGAVVLEKELELNLAVENQIVIENLKRLETVKKAGWQKLTQAQQKLLLSQIEQLTQIEKTYQQRLQQCIKSLIPKPQLPPDAWPVCYTHPLGLKFTAFRYNPEQHFPVDK